MKVSRSAISELESGKRRSISVAELLVLAAALDVAPVLLLFPEYPDGPVEATPGTWTTAHYAGQWLSGHVNLDWARDRKVPPRAEPLVELADQREALELGLANLMVEQLKSGTLGLEKVFEAQEQMQKQRDLLNDRIIEAGGVVHARGNGEG